MGSNNNTTFENTYDQFISVFKDIIHCAYQSFNWLKSGLHENAYEEGLKIELQELGYDVREQEEFYMWYKGQQTDKKFRLDLVVISQMTGPIILELKALTSVGDKELRQLHSYMRLTNTKYGILINFGTSKVYAEIWQYDPVTNKCVRIRY